MERLPNGGETRGLEGRFFNVVEPYDGDILRYSQTYVMERADAADRCDVVEREKCREAAVLCQELLHDRITKLGRREVFRELNGQFRPDDEAEILGYLHDALPSGIGVGTVGLAAHEGDGAVTQ